MKKSNLHKNPSWLRQLFDVYVREFRNIGKDVGLLLFFLFLPLAYPIIYSLIYNPELVRDVAVVVVDNDRTPLSRQFIRNIDATQDLWVKGYASDLNEARHAMASKDVFAIIEIPYGFEKKATRLEQATAVFYCDMTLLLRYKAALTAAVNVSQEMGADLQQQIANVDSPVAISMSDPLPIHNVFMGNTQAGFDSFILPGVIVLILHQCIILAVGMAGGARHEPKYLIGYDSYNEAPSVLMTMAGQMLCYITILFLPILFLVHYVPLIFSFPMAGNIFHILAFLLPMVLACMFLGYCIQGIIFERESIFILWVITSLVFLFLSGLTWPRFAMPRFWQLLGDCIPGVWGVEGFIRMETNGATIAQVLPCYRALWILAAVYGTAAYFIQRFIVRPAAVRTRLFNLRYPLGPAPR